jgi:hypothetical protein
MVLTAGLAVGLQRALALGAFVSPAAAAAASSVLAGCVRAAQHASAAPAEASRSLSTAAAEAVARMGSPAFVFDIDGVLIRGRNVLPEARKAMQLVGRTGVGCWGCTCLHAAATNSPRLPCCCVSCYLLPPCLRASLWRRVIHPSQLWRGGAWRSPVVFMTNGGGVSEAKKAAELSSWLDAPVEEDQARAQLGPGALAAARRGCMSRPVRAAG